MPEDKAREDCKEHTKQFAHNKIVFLITKARDHKRDCTRTLPETRLNTFNALYVFTVHSSITCTIAATCQVGSLTVWGK
jgi:hypothetical protein